MKHQLDRFIAEYSNLKSQVENLNGNADMDRAFEQLLTVIRFMIPLMGYNVNVEQLVNEYNLRLVWGEEKSITLRLKPGACKSPD